MYLDRRSVIRSAVCGYAVCTLHPLAVMSQSGPVAEVDVVATVLRTQCGEGRKHPVLVASERLNTGPMTVLATQPTPIQRAAHQVALPYLLPPAERMAEAEELAAAYNKRLERPAPPVVESESLNFRHRLLDGEAVKQFEALYMGGNVYSEKIEAQRRAVPSRYRRFFAESMTLWEVSRVAFASGGALAVVGLRSSGGNCSTERWTVLERSKNAWHDVPWGGGILTCA